MKYSLSLLALVGAAVAQDAARLSADGFPTCVHGCIQAANAKVECGVTDTACQCTVGYEVIQTEVTLCLAAEPAPCKSEDLAKVQSAADALCNPFKGAGGAAAAPPAAPPVAAPPKAAPPAAAPPAAAAPKAAPPAGGAAPAAGGAAPAAGGAGGAGHAGMTSAAPKASSPLKGPNALASSTSAMAPPMQTRMAGHLAAGLLGAAAVLAL